MTSYGNHELQNDLTNMNEVKLICYFFNTIVINNP